MKKRHVNIPIFIPHLGCPNACVFCNQRTISGHGDFKIESVRDEIESALSTLSADTEREIAFFGGSFTGIDRVLMIELLDMAESYVKRGLVSEIRLSTRPDYINSEILDILSQYSVRTIELGLQSLNDEVLCASRRGHNSECALSACKQIKERGFNLIGQMMIGLPKSTGESEIKTAELICKLHADGARVYPTVVFADTELSLMMKEGEYLPLDTESAVERTKNVLAVFDSYGVPCIRVGLCASENLRDASLAIAGATHSAIGEMAMSELFYDRICKELDERKICGGALKIFVPLGATSKAVGQKRKNKEKICKKYCLTSLKVLEKNELLGYNIILEHNN